MLQQIEVARLIPHPNNPRLDLGDLTELTESIKARGIMQNLTVMPEDVELYNRKISGKKAYAGNYIVIIGHRRTAAAKLAGIDKVLCAVVTDMDEMTQLATMLLENIQRNELTLVEQGRGFQLMLDMGENYKSISRQTGVSESTVRRKVKIVKTFGADAISKVQDRNIKLEDYERLCKVEDPEKQTEVFDKIGTNEFDWALRSAINAQEKEQRKSQIIGIISGFAVQVDKEDHNNAHGEYYWNFYRMDEGDIEEAEELADKINTDEKLSKRDIFFTVSSGYQRITIWAKDDDEPQEEDEVEKEKQRQINERMERHNRLMTMFKQAREMRISFVKKYRSTVKHVNTIDRMVVHALLQSTSVCEETLRMIFDIKHKFRSHWEKGEQETQEEAVLRIIQEYGDECYSGLDLRFIGAYCRLENSNITTNALERGYYTARYKENPGLTKIYEYLGSLGYVMSDEEDKLMNGTHELYTRSEEGN